MLKKIVNRLQGQVRIRVDAVFPERVLNLCGARNLSFWNLEWESPTTFTCCLSRRDWHALRRAAKRLDCTLTLLRREGAPYFVGRFRKRYALLAGLALWALLLPLGSLFIWDFAVEGNETVPTEEILRSLEKQGVGIGTFGFSLDAEDIRNHMLLDIPELAWMTVNVSGCRAYVQVRERVKPPEMVNERIPTNVVARRSGVVLNVRALDGVKSVLPGTAVEQGQLLISGVEDTDTFGARILAGMGTVQGRTWYSLTAHFPQQVTEKRYTGRERTCFSLVFGTRRVKFFANSSIEGREYDKITKRHEGSLFGLAMPVTLVTERCRFYEAEPRPLTAAEAKAAGEKALTDYLHTLVDPYGAVRSTLCSVRKKDGGFVVTLSAECEEQIGRSVPIYTENTP